MIQPTRAQMVDFISEHCRIKNTRIPRTRLEQLPDADLLDILVAQPEVWRAFSAYVRRMEENKNACSNQPQPMQFTPIPPSELSAEEKRLTQKLKRIIGQIIKDPQCFAPQLKCKAFLDDLPYGSIHSAALITQADRVSQTDGGSARLLRKYVVLQEEYFQRQKDKAAAESK